MTYIVSSGELNSTPTKSKTCGETQLKLLNRGRNGDDNAHYIKATITAQK